MQQELSYKDAGVDTIAGDTLVENIKPYAKKTMRPEVMAGIGGFGALFELSKKYSNPVLVSGTDGVGTKLKLAFELDAHDNIGQDLVAMSVNDILVQGAEPLFFLDYFACGKLDVSTATRVVKGIAYGCELSGCALIGGETAEMPDMYPAGEYDLAGFAVGAVEKENIIDGSKIKAGDIILGLGSSGPHSNGYSLIRKILKQAGIQNEQDFEQKIKAVNGADISLKQAIMAPTKIYVKSILDLISKLNINGLAHITGGGLTENLPRILNDKFTAQIDIKAWKMPAIFAWLQKHGNVNIHEMYRVFNCGIGMAIVLNAELVEQAIAILSSHNEEVHIIGKIIGNNISDNISVQYI
jgi:phosphoribosylformylglycinamidine cyclo-ligase